MLEVRGLTKRFQGVTALDHLSFDAAVRSVTAVIGPNGAGKSTIMNCVTGVLRADEGQATWNGTELIGRSPVDIAAAGIARSFQQARLLPDHTVLDNVMIGAFRLGHSGVFGALLRTPSVRRDERIMAEAARRALARLDAEELADLPVGRLTAGQMRIVAVARAIAAEPELLLLDEPAAGLTDVESERLATDLRSLVDESGVTVVLGEHHLPFVMSLSDHVVVVTEGRLLATGTPAEIRENPEVIDAYLGQE